MSESVMLDKVIAQLAGTIVGASSLNDSLQWDSHKLAMIRS